ncbi:hypothetical protein ABTX20_005515, partial [Salmonella enterica]
MKQTITRAVVGLLLGHASYSSAEQITVPTPDASADVLHTDLSHIVTDYETIKLVGQLKQIRGQPAFYKEMLFMDTTKSQQWSDAGFTNGAAIVAYADKLYRQVTAAATPHPTCQTTPGCNGEDVREGMLALLSETRKFQELYTDVKRVDDVLNGRTPQSPLTSESNIDASYVTDKRTYKMTADDN